MKKVFIVGGKIYAHYLNWIKDIYPSLMIVNSVEESDFVFFAGGEDVDPSLYGEPAGFRTYSNPGRDVIERAYFKSAIQYNKKMVGVCRGGQFLTAMAGGKLVQHMSHPYFHPVKTHDGKEIFVSSTHHQQFLLEGTGVNYTLLAHAEKLSNIHLNGEDKDYKFDQTYKEPEVVLYHDIQAFACQSHPEMLFDQRKNIDNGEMRDTLNKSIEWCQQELKNFLN